jgi:hypothetical protein
VHPLAVRAGAQPGVMAQRRELERQVFEAAALERRGRDRGHQAHDGEILYREPAVLPLVLPAGAQGLLLVVGSEAG